MPWKHKLSLHVNDAPTPSSENSGTYYAAYDEQAIWGIGNTPMAARLDARQFFDTTRGENFITQVTSALYVAKMTNRLKNKVEMSGGDVAFVLNGDSILDVE